MPIRETGRSAPMPLCQPRATIERLGFRRLKRLAMKMLTAKDFGGERPKLRLCALSAFLSGMAIGYSNHLSEGP